MKLFHSVFAACAILYVIRLAIVGLFVTYLAALTLALIVRTRETLGALAFWAVLALLQDHPLVAISGAIICSALLALARDLRLRL